MAKKKTLAELLREKRGAPPLKPTPLKKITLKAAAKQIGVTEAVLIYAERGSEPSRDNLMRLCEWLGVDPRTVVI